MLFLFAIVLFVLLVGLFGFMISNIDYTTSVTLINTDYHNVPLIYVVLTAVSAGAAATGLIALFEGAKIRFENRRLKRERHKLETELNYLRTQPSTSLRAETTTEDVPAGSRLPAPRRDDRPVDPPASTPASAPVYGSGSEDRPVDPDDDAYSGGRAV